MFNYQTKQTQQAKKELEVKAVSESLINAMLLSKKDEEQGPANCYKYEEYGKDHNREVEQRKEEEREKKRDVIRQQLDALSNKQRQIQTQFRTSVDAPSSKQKPTQKLEHKKLLLQQLELDRDKRKLAKQYQKLQDSVFISATSKLNGNDASYISSKDSKKAKPAQYKRKDPSKVYITQLYTKIDHKKFGKTA